MIRFNNKPNLNCLCVSLDPVLKIARWFGILPLISSGQKNKHFVNGCQFEVSKLWFTFSLIFQSFYIPYILVTSSVRVYYGNELNNQDGFGWYIMTTGYIAMEVDTAVTLIVGVIQTKAIGHILERLSVLPASFNDMRRISRQLKLAISTLACFYFILMTSFTIEACNRFQKVEITLKTFLDSAPGVIMRGLSLVFPQVQCMVVMMLSLLIASKFQHLSEATELSLKRASHYSSAGSHEINLVRPVTVEWMNKSDMTGLTATHLEQLGDLYREICDCVTQMNKCVGFQTLVALTVNLYVTIYQLYRYTTAYGRISQNRQHAHSMLSLSNLFIKLMLYVSIGQLIKNKHLKPASALQRGRILHLPSRLQQQIQTLLLQWSFTESGYLSAFNVMNIGPWLLAPIIGNVITYLLVAIQFDKATTPLSLNLTAYLESII